MHLAEAKQLAQRKLLVHFDVEVHELLARLRVWVRQETCTFKDKHPGKTAEDTSVLI